MNKKLILTKKDSQDKVTRIYQIEGEKHKLEILTSDGKKQFLDYREEDLQKIFGNQETSQEVNDILKIEDVAPAPVTTDAPTDMDSNASEISGYFAPRNNSMLVGNTLTHVKAKISRTGFLHFFKMRNPNTAEQEILEEYKAEITTTGIQDIPVSFTPFKEDEYLAVKKEGDTALFQYGGAANTSLPLAGFSYTRFTTKTFHTGSAYLGLAYITQGPSEKKSNVLEKIKELIPPTEKQLVQYFCGMGITNPTAVTANSNNTGYFSNNGFREYQGKKVTRVGFITGREGQLKILHIRGKTRPFNIINEKIITLLPGSALNWYEVNFDVGEDEYLFVTGAGLTGQFKYASTNTSNGTGFVNTVGTDTGTWDFPTSLQQSYLGFGIEVEEEPAKNKTPYTGKNISFIGDSISTFPGWSIPGNALYYIPSRITQFGIDKVEKTWWHQVATTLGANIMTVDTWSGSRMSGTSGAAVNMQRSYRLDTRTDILLMMIGINDFSGDVPLGEIAQNNFDNTTFVGAYQKSLEQMMQTYPKMEIVLITPFNRFINGAEQIKNTIKCSVWGNKVKEIAAHYGLKCIDLKEIGHTKINNTSLLPDNTHPNELGMDRMARHIVSHLL